MTISDNPAAPPVMRVREPGELIGAVPLALGFHPRESLVLVALTGRSGRRLGLTLRVDLPPPDDVPDLCGYATERFLVGDPAGAVVLVVGGTVPGRYGPPGAPSPGGGAAEPSAPGGPPRRDVAEAAAAALEARGVTVRSVLWAAETGPGAAWACYEECACGGHLPPAEATPMAAATVVAGRVVHGDRGALERLVAPVDAAVLRRRDALLRAAHDSGPERSEREVARAARDALRDALADTAAGRLVLDDARVVTLAAALSVPAVRDAAMLTALGARAPAAEQLWAALARESPAPEAAEPAALLAVCALARGDGALANVALDRARAAWPGHRLARLLAAVAEGGLRPDEVRALVAGAVEDLPSWAQVETRPPRGVSRRRARPRSARRR